MQQFLFRSSDEPQLDQANESSLSDDTVIMGKEDGMRKVRRFSVSKKYADQDISRLEKSEKSAAPVDDSSSLN